MKHLYLLAGFGLFMAVWFVFICIANAQETLSVGIQVTSTAIDTSRPDGAIIPVPASDGSIAYQARR